MHRAAGRFGIGGIVFEFLAGNAIPALLTAFDHIALGLHPGEKLLNDGAMARVSGADEAVVGDLPAGPQLSIALTDGVAMGLGRNPGRFCRPLNLLAMLITAGDEPHGFTDEPPIAGHGIAGQGGVGTAEVGPVVDVIERGGEGVRHAAGSYPGSCWCFQRFSKDRRLQIGLRHSRHA